MWIKVTADEMKIDGKKVDKGETVNVPAPMAAHLLDAGHAEQAEPPKGHRAETGQAEVIADAQDEPSTVQRAKNKSK